MKKRTNKIKNTAALLALMTLSVFGLSSCENLSNKVEVWSTYNTLKVMQSLHEYPKLDAKISTELFIGETEGAQLLYTPESDIDKFELVQGELKSGENLFNAENIKIYVQKYVNVIAKTHLQKNDAYPTGYTPDFLLPMDLACEYGENNSKAGNNQGFYVEFTADSETLPGTYTGVFLLKTDDITTEIPVAVTVRNITVSHSYGKSSFGLYQNMLMYGEMDSSDEMYTRYYESLMRDYKTLLMHVPNGLELDKFADSVIHYYDEPQFISYGIPCFGGGDAQFDEAAFYDYVYEIASRCTPDKIYLDKAYVYPLMADEPASAAKREIMNQVTKARDLLDEVIIERLNNAGFFEQYGGIEGDFALVMKDVLDNLSCVITTDAIEGFGEEVDSYCPPIQYFSTSYLRELYKDHEARNSGETWFYTCMQPLYPYPSHHVDDYLIGSRTMRWMQMAYGLEGYLYWNTSWYTASGYVDCYTDPVRFYQNGAPYNGDGYLTYPGAKYGHKGFLPSLRLVAYRDGQEDYDLLCYYEECLKEVYGDEISVNEVFASSYASLFGGAIYNPDDRTLLSERALLLDRTETLNSETGLVAYITERGPQKILNVYAKANTEVFVNGEKVKTEAFGDGVTYTTEITQGVAVKAQKGQVVSELELSIGKKKVASSLTTTSVQMSDTSTVSASENGLHMFIRSKGSTAIELNSFKPGFYLKGTAFGGDFKNLDSFCLELDNQSNKSYPIEIMLTLKDGTSVTLDKFNLKPGENIININNVPLYYDFTGKKPEKLRVVFPNSINNVLVDDCEVVLSKLSYTLKGE